MLGWAPTEYSDYAQRVRYEYQHVEDDKFLEGRAKVLEHLGDGDIYFTQYFQERYEAQAKQNLAEEQAMLEGLWTKKTN